MIRIGIICPSEIAFRRFMPSLQKIDKAEYVGIAYASPNEWFGEDLQNTSQSVIDNMKEKELSKAMNFQKSYGGKIYEGYGELIRSNDIEAIYIPLPPALHVHWASMALKCGKHVLVEKPSTTSYEDTKMLVDLAKKRDLALHENYMFMFHNQIAEIDDVVKSGEIGDVRLYRISFGFPRRLQNDFRYNKNLGGGALLDAGGYTFKLANHLLGGDAHIIAAQSNMLNGFEVDMYGSAMMVNENGATAHVAFGMDNDYRCELEVWGSLGTITANRILTAPCGFEPEYIIKKNQDYETRKLSADDAFGKSIQHFLNCIDNAVMREDNYRTLLKQESLVSEFLKLAK